MPSLADLPELVGFFSYSREDDEAFEGTLSALRDAIQRELSAQLGRSRTTFRLWQDQKAIAPGQAWELEIKTAVEQAVFFIPIVTPRAVTSHYCKFEFETFLAREQALGRTDLVFPLLYIRVPALENEAQWREDPVLSIIGKRQYVDWRTLRHLDVRTTAVREAMERLCDKIVEALREPWISPEERRKQEQIEAQQREKERRAEAVRQRAEAARLAEEEKQRAGAAQQEEEKRRREGLRYADFAGFRDAPFAPELVVVPGGDFWMGSPEEEEDRIDHEGPRHRVTIGERFAIGRYPVTFDEFDRFCEAMRREKPGDAHWGRGRRPVINVSRDDAHDYLAWLSQETGQPYRLPSEAEWEYTCRAGTTTRYSFGDAITSGQANCIIGFFSWFRGGKTSEVGTYSSNPWGLYDMHGNVGEWVEDVWHENYQGAPSGGSAWKDAGARQDLRLGVLRGGSWQYIPMHCRSASRSGGFDSGSRNNDNGFRVARTLS